MDWDNEYWSAGKLLLTSEYVVIDGAEALAIPSRFGQGLKVKHNDTGEVHWVSKTNENKVWLEVKLDANTLEVISSSDNDKGKKLSEILKAAKSLTTTSPTSGAIIETQLDFPQDWGLGSSSTLLCNIAKWLDIDAFALHFSVSKGSGYDIACGLSDQPITYQVNDQKASYQPVIFDSDFKENIYFIHLNQKQFSDQEVARYSELKSELDLPEATKIFTQLTHQMIEAQTLAEFESLIREHENLMSHILQRETIKESLFQMYAGGVIKSLGAWGGDFVMVTAKSRQDLDYFRHKGYCTIISFKDMIKQ